MKYALFLDCALAWVRRGQVGQPYEHFLYTVMSIIGHMYHQVSMHEWFGKGTAGRGRTFRVASSASKSRSGGGSSVESNKRLKSPHSGSHLAPRTSHLAQLPRGPHSFTGLVCLPSRYKSWVHITVQHPAHSPVLAIMPGTPVILFKTPSEPPSSDAYHIRLTDAGFHPLFVPVLAERWVLRQLVGILRGGRGAGLGEEISVEKENTAGNGSEDEATEIASAVEWEGVIISSRRGAEGWIQAAREASLGSERSRPCECHHHHDHHRTPAPGECYRPSIASRD